MKTLLVLLSLLTAHPVHAAYFADGDMIEGVTSTATAGTTTTLTKTSSRNQIFTGASNQNVVLPDARTVKVGKPYQIRNSSTGTLTIKDNGANTLATLAAGEYATFLSTSAATANGSWNIRRPSQALGTSISVDVTGNLTGNVTGNVTGNLTGNVTGNVTGNLTGNVTGAVTGNASTASALAANPSDCGANTFATTIAANGDLTCSAVGDSALSTSYLKADGSRGLSADWNAGAHSITASTFIGAVTGNASTASALAANPTDCGANNYATAIDASGNLTCGQVSAASGLTGIAPVANGGSGVPSLTAHAVIIGNGTGTVTSVSPGAVNNVLKSDGTDWVSGAPPAGVSVLNVRNVTASTTSVATDDTITVDTSGGALTVTLLAPAGNTGKVFRIKKTTTDTNIATIQGTNTNVTIDTTTATTIADARESITLMSDGTNYQVLGRDMGAGCEVQAVTCSTTNRYGSSDTMVPRLVQNDASACGSLTYTTSTVIGTKIVANAPGTYAGELCLNKTSGNERFGITVNESAGGTTTSAMASTLTYAQGFRGEAIAVGGSTSPYCIPFSSHLNVGDILRPHTEGGTALDTNTAICKMRISRQGP